MKKIVQTAGRDALGAPNDAFAKYFSGKSYLAPVSNELVGYSMLHLSRAAATTGIFAVPHLAVEVPGEETSTEWCEPVK